MVTSFNVKTLLAMAAFQDGPFFTGTAIDNTGCLDYSDDFSEEKITDSTIEYDDDAILAFNPALRDDLGKNLIANYTEELDSEFIANEESFNYRKCSQGLNISEDNVYLSDTELGCEDTPDSQVEIRNSSSCGGTRSASCEADDNFQTNNQQILASGDMAFGCERAVERLTRVIVSRIQKSIPQIHNFKQEIAQMQDDVKKLKEEYSELDNTCRKVSITQNRLVKAARSFIHDLDLVIYQNKVINHLDNAEKQMKVFECHVTPDKRIVLVDPDSIGTDVDKPNLYSVSQTFSVID